MAGGIAAAVAGLIVTQQSKTSPLEHYNIVGYVVVVISMFSIYQIYRVRLYVKSKAKTASMAVQPQTIVTE